MSGVELQQENCYKCGKTAIKTDGNCNLICYNLAYYGDCNGVSTTHIRVGPKIGRNSKCSCGSNKKYKNCCLVKNEQQMSDKLINKVLSIHK